MNQKEEKYLELIQKLSHLIDENDSWISKLANCSALLHSDLGHFWTGFYLVDDKELTLGPFQGPVACTRIAFGKGVCGTAWSTKLTQVVEDVHKFPGHIACSAESNSEIVVPLIKANEVIAVLDIDSTEKGTFDQTDKKYLEQVAALLIEKSV